MTSQPHELSRCEACGAQVSLAWPVGTDVRLAVEPAPDLDGPWLAIQVGGVWRIRRVVGSEGSTLDNRLRRAEHVCAPGAGSKTMELARLARLRGGRWVVAKTPADQPYPCLCDPEHGCEPAGWRQCPCAGRRDLMLVPLTCCARRFAPDTVIAAMRADEARRLRARRTRDTDA